MSEQFTPDEVAKLKALVASQKKTTHIIQVLDKSSSMATGIDITISSYNEMLDVAKKAQQPGDETTATLITFSNEAKLEYQKWAIGSVAPLNRDNYVPNGMTALYDAIGLAIETASKFPTDDNTAFLLQIFTDGGENASSKYRDPSKLKSMIEELNATGKWTVTVAGPQGSIDLFAQQLSIAKGNITSFDPNSLQSRTMNAANMVASTAHYFSARAAGQSMVVDAYSAVVQSDTTDGTVQVSTPVAPAVAQTTVVSEATQS